MKKIYWIDLETTGLDYNVDKILEIAIAESDLSDPFNAKLIYESVISYPTHLHSTRMDKVVIKMHTRNGLFDECDAAPASQTVSEVERQILELIPRPKDRSDLHILGGSCVHFDAKFLEKEMPFFAAYFSHRHYDVSAIKLFCESVSLGMPPLKKSNTHRAKSDIFESIRHAEECRDWMLGLTKFK